jgi:serine/threonine-protein kinase
VEQACEYVRQAGQGLQHAHQLGLVHRDIKPANLFLLHPPTQGRRVEVLDGGLPRRGPDPVVKVLDWGLARLMRAPGEAGDAPRTFTPSDSLVAEKGKLIGTADYIAPEQARDPSLVDTRADIYSLGCAFFYLLTGRPPFTAGTLMQKLLQHQEEPPPPIQSLRPDVPDEVAAALAKMMAKKPEDRLQIPLLVVAALRRFSSAAPTPPGVLRPSVLTQNGAAPRPGSAMNLSRPGSSLDVTKPGSAFDLNRPASSPNLQPPRR